MNTTTTSNPTAPEPNPAPPAPPAPSPLARRARVGKIARLPAAIRHELNQRLHDGQSAKALLPWLNSLPETKAVLDAQFEGRPISKQNLSEWYHGGFRDWLTRQQALDFLADLEDPESLGHPALAAPLADKLARWLALQLAVAAQDIARIQDPELRWKRLREFSAEVCRLRRADLSADRLRLDRDWLTFEQSNTQAAKEKEFWAWTEREDVRRKLDPDWEPGLRPETLAKIERELNLF